MKVLFLDIDGVVNCATTPTRSDNFVGIDPYMALLVDRIVQATGCSIVLSSSWRYHEESMAEVRQKVCDFIDVTPMNNGLTSRGTEIKTWLDAHREVTRYASLARKRMLTARQPTTVCVVSCVVTLASLPVSGCVGGHRWGIVEGQRTATKAA